MWQISYITVEEVPKKKLTVENSTSALPNITVEGSPQNVSEVTTENLNNEGGLNITDSSLHNQNNTDLGTEKKLKKRSFRIPLKARGAHLVSGSFDNHQSLVDAIKLVEMLRHTLYLHLCQLFYRILCWWSLSTRPHSSLERFCSFVRRWQSESDMCRL